MNVLYSPGGVFSGSKRKRDENRECPVTIQALSTAFGEGFTVRLGDSIEWAYHNKFTSVNAVTALVTSSIDEVVDHLKPNLRWAVNCWMDKNLVL
ncbi:uncharacterized protein EAF01_008628 [Botrytis porri]|uniref:uncharacterized protein n=1 Tax=Botrytis porri TaxID=87229 RepID=UPI0019003767|nr:uncharacterized protein EAF01_008628 [Botrytis porri]KAF7897662.1 hypothetical protein EAF01_008628 [Botrytis porri]